MSQGVNIKPDENGNLPNFQMSTSAMYPLGMVQQITPYGTAKVSGEPSTKFSDPFDGGSLDSTNRWSTFGSTSAPTQANGTVTFNQGTANSAASTLISQPTFPATIGFNIWGATLTLEAAQLVNPNVHRFWGFGQVTSYTAATPVTDGIGFECDTTGAVNCVVYIGGTRYVVNSTNAALITAQGSLPAGASASNFGQTLSFPSRSHRYAIVVRGDIAFFFIDSFDAPIAYASHLQPNVQALPYRVAAVTTPAVSTVLAVTFQLGAAVVGDSASQNNTLSDPIYPWRGATVKAPSTAAAATDSPLVVALHPNSPMYESDSFAYLAGATAGTLVKSGAGTLRKVSINTKGTTATLTIYNNTSATGAIIAVVDLTAQVTTLFFDAAFTLGCYIVVTGTLSDITITYR